MGVGGRARVARGCRALGDPRRAAAWQLRADARAGADLPTGTGGEAFRRACAQLARGNARGAAQRFLEANQLLPPGEAHDLPLIAGASRVSRVEPRFGAIASVLAGKDVEARCWSRRDWVKLMREESDVHRWAARFRHARLRRHQRQSHQPRPRRVRRARRTCLQRRARGRRLCARNRRRDAQPRDVAQQGNRPGGHSGVLRDPGCASNCRAARQPAGTRLLRSCAFTGSTIRRSFRTTVQPTVAGAVRWISATPIQSGPDSTVTVESRPSASAFNG